MRLILDYGAELISVEIKAGKTISSDYFKGIDYYHELCGTKNKKRIVVYAGEQSMRYKDIDVYSYFELEKLFNGL